MNARSAIVVAAVASAIALAMGAAIAVAAVGDRPAVGGPLGATIAPLPQRLSGTGLYADRKAMRVAGSVVPFAPQYPLWSDGTNKRRWIRLPAATFVDASDPDTFAFPPGTRLWKEFGYERRVETRLIERLADGSWRFASYVWNADGSEATLAPEDGLVLENVPGAPGGRYTIPSRADCLACHEGAPVPVLGFSALQLSPDRDPLAPHAPARRAGDADLAELVARGLVRNLPKALVDTPPRIAAPTPTARAALGYLHGNCGHCHNAAGALPGLELSLAQSAVAPAQSAERTLRSLVGRASRFRAQGAQRAERVVPGRAGESIIAARMQSQNPLARMPPLGVTVIDAEGLALVERWIQHDLQPEEPKP
jgi:hypothetical protein